MKMGFLPQSSQRTQRDNLSVISVISVVKKMPVLPLFLVTILFACPIQAEQPWGKDAELARWNTPRCQQHPRCNTPILGPFAECMIRFHQKVISPADGPRSSHKPSSSQYTLDAMRKYGFFCGYLLGCDRLMRENEDPWIYPVVKDEKGDIFKYDPVK